MRNPPLTARICLPILLAGVVVRALVPAGYMPAAPGSGLLFELCHGGMPVAMMVALKGGGHAHGHHAAHAAEHHGSHHDSSGHHRGHGDSSHAGHHDSPGNHSDHDNSSHAGHHGGHGHCTIGHLLSMVFLDTDSTTDFPERSIADFYVTEPVDRLFVIRRYSQAPRGPPLA